MALALGRRAEDRDDAAERVDLDRRRIHGARLRQVLWLRAELRVERRGHVAHVGYRRVDGERKPDPDVAPRGPRRRLLAPQLVVARELERAIEGGRIVPAVVEPAARRAVRRRSGLDRGPSPHAGGIDAATA